MELTEIKSELDLLYQEYKDKKNNLSGIKTQSVVELIINMISAKDADYHDVAVELARFSADVTKLFFENITKSKIIPFEVISDILQELANTDNDSKLSQYYVSKYVFAIIAIMGHYKEDALKSSLLPQMVVFIAHFAINSNKNKDKFRILITNTSGNIFKLDYSGVKRDGLITIWNATKTAIPNIEEISYKLIIINWKNKYISNNNRKETNTVSEDTKADIHVEKPVTTRTDITAPTENTENTITENFCDSVMKNMSENKNDIINVVTELVSPISRTINSIQGEINKIRETEIENINLRAKVDVLERQLSEQKDILQNTNLSLMSAETENDTLRQKVIALESQNSELESKLNDAYTINNRNSALEVEKVRSELKKSFEYLYEDWLEYESSEVNEENYQSLQAIIKKTFRSLERNGIKFKEG